MPQFPGRGETCSPAPTVNVTQNGSGTVNVVVNGTIDIEMHPPRPLSVPRAPTEATMERVVEPVVAAARTDRVKFRQQEAAMSREKKRKRTEKDVGTAEKRILEGGKPAKGRKPHYTTEQQLLCLAMLDRVGNQKRAAIRAIKANYEGFHGLGIGALNRWLKNRAATGKLTLKPPGRSLTAPEAFELEVFDELVFQVVEVDEDGQLSAETVANVCYSYSIVRTAVDIVRQRPQWVGNDKLQKLKMSNEWCQGFIQRALLSRRKVTTKLSVKKPSEGVVSAAMSVIQEKGRGIPLDLRINMDETGISATGANYQYAASDQDRAATHEFGNKERITAIIAATASGRFLPQAFIVKCAPGITVDGVRGADQTNIRVLKYLMHEDGFKECEGWRHSFWERSRSVIVGHSAKKEEKTVQYKRAFLLNQTTGAVVFAQSKAWADSMVIEMWVDVVLVPFIANLRVELKLPTDSKALLVWDNAPAHKLSSSFSKNNIEVGFLPPNCTSTLQV